LRNTLNWFESLDDNGADSMCLRLSSEVVYQIHRTDHSRIPLSMPVGSSVRELVAALEEDGGIPGEQVLVQLSSSAELVELMPCDRCVYTSMRLNDCLYFCTRKEMETLTAQHGQQQPTTGTYEILEVFSSKQLANQLTDYDWELFNCIHQVELVRHSFGERLSGMGTTANLARYLRRFNEVQYWAASEICLCPDLERRARLLKKFIKVAACCKEQRNMNSFFAIMFGLSNAAVSRLSETWERIPSRTRRMYQGFERLLDPTRNHKVYRQTVIKMNSPFLPFLPLLLKDMTFIQEGNKTFVNNLVNFEKMRMMARVVNLVRRCRSSPY
ncbi:rap guanine nucleotide exchange factor 4-like, partial [Scyliorhinus canicula]|uniref:rap guanine nucleotide exchange factor 4-like n=1 Tax=Scyliorhinus canicula TaxID=7830 RepID=UPI0018F7C7DC